MGELAKRRGAKDLWVSRSHLYALAAGTLVCCATAFAIGLAAGRRAEAVQPMALPVARDDEQLVELLARVEASARPHGGLDDLTFPSALAGEVGSEPADVPVVDEGAEPELPAAAVEPSDVEPPTGDAPPSGHFTIALGPFEGLADGAVRRDALRAAGVPAWLDVERVDGQLVQRVAVGGYPDEQAAKDALAGMKDPLGAEVEAAEVAPLR